MALRDRLLGDPDRLDRRGLARAARFGSDALAARSVRAMAGDAAAVLAFLDDPRAAVRRVAFDAIGGLGRTDRTEDLRAAWRRERTEEGRLRCAVARVRLGDATAEDELVRFERRVLETASGPRRPAAVTGEGLVDRLRFAVGPARAGAPHVERDGSTRPSPASGEVRETPWNGGGPAPNIGETDGSPGSSPASGGVRETPGTGSGPTPDIGETDGSPGPSPASARVRETRGSGGAPAPYIPGQPTGPSGPSPASARVRETPGIGGGPTPYVPGNPGGSPPSSPDPGAPSSPRAPGDLDPSLQGRDTRRALLALAATRDPAAFDRILALFPSSGRRGEHTLIEALGQLGDPRALPLLRDVLRATDVDPGRGFARRRLAAVALGRIGAREAVPWLVRALDDEAHDWEGRPGAGLGVQFPVRTNLLWALGEIGDASAIPTLLPYLGDVSGSALGGFFLPAMDALWKIGSPAIPALTAFLARAPEVAAANAVGVLGALGVDTRRHRDDPRGAVRAVAGRLAESAS